MTQRVRLTQLTAVPRMLSFAETTVCGPEARRWRVVAGVTLVPLCPWRGEVPSPCEHNAQQLYGSRSREHIMAVQRSLGSQH